MGKGIWSRLGSASLMNGLLLPFVVMVTGCGERRSVSSPERATTQVPSWRIASDKDAMTDKVTHRLVSNDHAPISVSCTDNDNEIIVLESDVFLGNGPSMMVFRYDNDQPLEINAYTAKNMAIVRRDAGADLKSGDPAQMLNSETAFILLREPHERLRIRLTSFDQETRDLAFSAHGLASGLRALEKGCGLDKDGNWPRNS